MNTTQARGSLVFERVSKHYGKSIAVDDISFRIEPGTMVTLLCPSGCGKTTTLRMIAGLERVDAGRILIGYYEPHINSWDCVAGIVLVREAGGVVNDFLAGNGLLRGNPIIAACDGFYPTLATLIAG